MIGGIQLVFLIAMLGIEAVQRPATKLCLRITSKIGCATQRRPPREGDEDVEEGGVEDGGAASSGSDDEDRPLLEPNRGGAMTQDERFAALEAMLSGVRHDVADTAALYTKTRDNATLIRALFDGGSTPSTLRNDPRDELWAKTTLVAQCTGDADRLHERALFALGEFTITSARAPSLRPTWERAVEGETLRIYFHRQRWRIGVLGEAPFARSVEKASTLSPLEVVWEVRANGAAWEKEEALFFSSPRPRSGNVFERFISRTLRNSKPQPPAVGGDIEMVDALQSKPIGRDIEMADALQSKPNPMRDEAPAATADGDALTKGVPPVAAVLGLPVGWSAVVSSSGAPYYWNAATGVKQWELPSQPGGDSADTARVPAPAAAMRRASDGAMYTRAQFVAHYGDAVKWRTSR
jgi:hypothetical protein